MPKTFRGVKKFTECLDRLYENPCIADMCRRAGITQACWYLWMRQSEAGELPGIFYFEYNEVSAWLHEHVDTAYTCSISTIESGFRSSGAVGTWVWPIYNSGKIVWEEDAELAALGLKFCQDVLGLEDMDKRVINPKTGNLEKVPAKQWIPPRVDTVQKILQSHSAEYADKRSLDVNVNGSLGVTVGALNLPRPPQQLQIIDQVITEQIVDASSDPEPIEVEPEEVIAPEPKPTPPSALSIEEKALMDRLRSPNAMVRDFAQQALDKLRNPEA